VYPLRAWPHRGLEIEPRFGRQACRKNDRDSGKVGIEVCGKMIDATRQLLEFDVRITHDTPTAVQAPSTVSGATAILEKWVRVGGTEPQP
jgi:hypothetical protein